MDRGGKKFRKKCCFCIEVKNKTGAQKVTLMSISGKPNLIIYANLIS